MTEPQFQEPKTIELVGGPCDGMTINWPGGLFAVVRDFDRRKEWEYTYEMHRNGNVMTVKTAHFVGEWRCGGPH